MSVKTAVIVGAGDFFETRDTMKKADILIAADGGGAALRRIGLTPDVLIGDFDSLDEMCAAGETKRLPKEKDDTDMMAAVKVGFERGCTLFYVYGGTGGRFDHSIANVQMLSWLAEHGAGGFLFDETTVSTVIRDGEIVLTGEKGRYVSVFCLSDTATGVTLDGLKYSLSDATLTNAFPLGVSNELTGVSARVAVKNGMLLVVAPRK